MPSIKPDDWETGKLLNEVDSYIESEHKGTLGIIRFSGCASRLYNALEQAKKAERNDQVNIISDKLNQLLESATKEDLEEFDVASDHVMTGWSPPFALTKMINLVRERLAKADFQEKPETEV